MRLKELTLTGYKTFADKITFKFDEGITAIIGPNGSGKSNVADAIRWALGEQSFSLLRGKRTDDMIFSGSAKRARASMAEVLMTFDNSDGFFPIEFTDVTMGRRAFRDGGNEYVLNGNRVRLRDIGDLLGNSGLAERTYTVIGQGLVDTALQLKPDERRALFEEAAGIAQYRDRRDDALRKLEETTTNLQRATDILSEVTPRLKTLERQAERAIQYKHLAAELEQHTRVWFAWHFHDNKRKIAASAQSRDAARAVVDEANQIVGGMDAEVAGLREQQSALKSKLAEVQPQLDEARRRSEQAARELAVLVERQGNLQTQIENLKREIDERSAAIVTLETRAVDANTALIAAQAHLKERQAALDEAQKVAAEFRAQRAALEAERNAAQMHLMKLNAQLSGAQNRLNVLRARQTSILALMSEFNTRVQNIADQRARGQDEVAQFDARIAEDAQRAQALATAAAEASQNFEAARSAHAATQSAAAASEAEFKMAERMNTFVQLRAQSKDGDLAANISGAGIPGFKGILATLIKIHQDDEKAVRAALGDALTAVVLEDAEGVTRARAWLSRQNNERGRLTAIGLPNMRVVDDEWDLADRAAADIARGRGAQPVRALINAPEWLSPALQLVVGRAFVCRNLDEAQALAAALPAGSVCVTRDGDVAFASGSLALTAGQRRAVVIGDEAEHADVLMDLDAARARLATVRAERDAAAQQLDLSRRAMDEANRVRVAFDRECAARVAQREQQVQRHARFDDQEAQLNHELQRAQTEQVELQTQVTELAGGLSVDEAQQHEAQNRVTALEQQLLDQAEANLQPQIGLFEAETPAMEPLINGDTARTPMGWMDALNFATAEVATAQANVRSAGQQLTQWQTELHNNKQALAVRQQRLAEASQQLAAAADALTAAEGEAAASKAALAETELRAAPIQGEVAAIDQRVIDADTRRRDAERALRDASARLNTHELELARHEDEMTSLRERAADMLETEAELAPAKTEVTPVAAETATDGLATDQPAPEDAALAFLESLEPIDEMPEGTDEKVHSLRASIKRLGSINFEAQAEYEELSVRHKFISEQSEDLTKAVASLQQIIADLNEVMKDTFRRTFEAIAAEFVGTFKVLFGGGQAKLTLVNADNIDESGVEIQAQPPGKRPQSLALLSGGERSMTAAALLFAILKVKPTPFCVLDEMDAALDEANVYRFRSMVESLNDRTQFIIITHNRRTVEAADAVYGISMGADSASIALSLKLEDADAEMKARGGG